MTGVIVDEKILHEMIEIILPDLSQKFKNIELDTSIFSIPWFICLFTSTKLDEKVFKLMYINHNFLIFHLRLYLLYGIIYSLKEVWLCSKLHWQF